jgi:hypothetical protein
VEVVVRLGEAVHISCTSWLTSCGCVGLLLLYD